MAARDMGASTPQLVQLAAWPTSSAVENTAVEMSVLGLSICCVAILTFSLTRFRKQLD